MIARATSRARLAISSPSASADTGIDDMICKLQDKVAQAIDNEPHVNRQHLRFETREGRVILRGVVGSYFQKQMAQEAIRGIDGVQDISNELEVSWSS